MAKSKEGANSFLLAVGVAFVAVALFAFNFLVQGAMTEDEGDIIADEMMVAPSILQLHSKGESMIIHTNVPASKIIASSMRLNGLPVAKTKVDDRGDMVGYWDLEAVKEIVVESRVKQFEVVLTGDLVSGGNLTGSKYISYR